MPRIRPEGGVIGVNNTPTIGAATGMWSMHDVVRNTRNSTWPEDFFGFDPYFDLNSLLFHADSTNGRTNTSYIDSSPNAYTATASGRPYQGTMSPFSLTGWSNYFNGSSYFTYASNAAFGFGTGDFTIETWIYLTANASSGGTNILDFRATATAVPWTFNVTNSGSGNFVGAYTSSGVTGVNAPNTFLALNTWYHIAITRTSGTWKIFINGVDQTLAGSGYNRDLGTSNPITVGATVGGGSPLNGYLSNLRIVKGTSLYTATFTPTDAPLTAISGTSLLICQSNRFRDNSGNGFSATPVSAPTVESFSPFNPSAEYSTTTVGGSAYFNGSTDYITLPNNMTAAGNAAYTLEGWFYPTTVAAAEIPIVKLFNATQTIELRIVSSRIQGKINNSATTVGGNTTLYPNQWYHFALVKSTASPGTTVLYINGVAEATTASDTTTYTAFTTPRIGANQTPNIYYTGWASNVRFITGVAQYTSNFTPPTAPFTSSSELFLLNFTNSGIIDQTSKNNLSTFGSAAVSTTQSKFGGSSLSCITGTSYLLTLASNTLELGGSDFTIEFWWYPVSTVRQALYHGSFGTDWSIGIDYSNVSTNQKIGIWASSSGTSWNLINADTAGNGIGTTTVTQNAWNHIAYVRNGTTWMLFVNGNRDLNLTAISGSIVSRPTAQKAIGAWFSTAAFSPQTGYIDDFRITRFARYTSNFTPSSTPFKNR